MERVEQRAQREMQEDTGPGAKVPVPPGVQIERDLAYGTHPVQRLDVYRPANAQGAPIVFMIHGGAWMLGDKSAPRLVGNKVARWVPKGYIVVSANHRKAPEADPLEQANDVAKALAFTQSQARGWGGDASRVVLLGHSAGAHLVALLTADPSIGTQQGARPWLGTVALDSAAFDIVDIMRSPHPRFYDRVFKSDPAYWRAASPTHRLTTAPRPMLVVCSIQRSNSCAQAEKFASKANALGGRVTVLPVAMDHGELNEALGADPQYTDVVEGFLRSLGLT
ncbi:alpha/beta hydrolase [Piscinibacter sp.]|uniref:alpha/beta hydrolase n=1 Tax=Piscinibacter sp. TaxID=1903157 RepID=UPI002C064324|nr:alpha/beta hydrolase [Albitalea sp.]HUG25192.1 alpha/beta hydrolase [Albitalea sp.]